MPVSFEQFAGAMARVPGPVAVVTTVDGSGRRWGFTASSFVSLSADPPLVLVCLGKEASTYEAFAFSRCFLVSVLACGQAGVAARFAASGVDRFEAGDTVVAELGLPGVPGAAARLGCSMHEVLDGGDHSILVGRVEAVARGDRPALVYCDRVFARPAVAEDAGRVVSAS
ncbi:flavin reductase family protein [Streptosporangium sp. NPDC051022]|uniref:flavin reductase family protein n=1 Tax=Streptosporangium sp. NPDC051022 TaxID=3155752 RepID=UPI0034464FFC